MPEADLMEQIDSVLAFEWLSNDKKELYRKIKEYLGGEKLSGDNNTHPPKHNIPITRCTTKYGEDFRGW